MLKYLRETSLNHRNLLWTGGHLNAWNQLPQFYVLSRIDALMLPRFTQQRYICGCRCLIICLAAGPMLMKTVDPVSRVVHLSGDGRFYCIAGKEDDGSY